MELTQEQKEYQKNYREVNKETLKEKQKIYKENNKDRIKEYLTNYYKENREHIREQQKEYRENNVYLDAVYFFIDNTEDVLYIGSSSRLNERISNHMTKHSNLKMTAEELANIGLNKIIYKDFSECGLSRADLFFIERYFKDNVEELIGRRKKVGYKEEELTRSKEELIRLAEETDYTEFNKLNRYLN